MTSTRAACGSREESPSHPAGACLHVLAALHATSVVCSQQVTGRLCMLTDVLFLRREWLAHLQMCTTDASWPSCFCKTYSARGSANLTQLICSMQITVFLGDAQRCNLLVHTELHTCGTRASWPCCFNKTNSAWRWAKLKYSTTNHM